MTLAGLIEKAKAAGAPLDQVALRLADGLEIVSAEFAFVEPDRWTGWLSDEELAQSEAEEGWGE